MKYMAVQCYRCCMLQVKQMKTLKSRSSSKWCCSVCNEKQSVRKVYYTSDSPKDVRAFVQKFNLTTGLAAEAEAMATVDTSDERPGDASTDFCSNEEEEDATRVGDARRDYSKWERFLPDEEHVCSESWDTSEQSLDDNKYVTSLPDPPNRKKNRSRSSPRKYFPAQPEKKGSGLINSSKNSKFGNVMPSVTEHHALPSSRIDKAFNLKRGRDA